MPRVIRGNSERISSEGLQRDGYAILSGLAGDAVVDRLARDLEPFFARTPPGESVLFGTKTRRFGSLFAKSETARTLATHPAILSLMDTILGPHCDRYQINLSQAIRIEPGEREQICHRDDELFPWPHPGAEFMVNAMWALDDFTDLNGGTHLWPGSHLEALTRAPGRDRAVAAEMPRGSVLIYPGSLLHCGGANRTERPRTGVVISYSLGWLRQTENQYLAYPPEIARTFPPALQELIGYAIHRPNLGWYEGQDPRVLFEGRPDALPARDYLPTGAAEGLEKYYRSLTHH